MAGHFVNITSELGDMIADAVQKAVEQLNEKVPEHSKLTSVLWYQGASIWFIQREEEDEHQTILRRVQIMPFWSPDPNLGTFLSFVPQLFAMPKDENVIKAIKQINTKNIGKLRIRELEDLDSEGFYGKFYLRVRTAWKIASRYQLSQLDETIPGRPFSELSPAQSTF